MALPVSEAVTEEVADPVPEGVREGETELDWERLPETDADDVRLGETLLLAVREAETLAVVDPEKLREAEMLAVPVRLVVASVLSDGVTDAVIDTDGDADGDTGDAETEADTLAVKLGVMEGDCVGVGDRFPWSALGPTFAAAASRAPLASSADELATPSKRARVIKRRIISWRVLAGRRASVSESRLEEKERKYWRADANCEGIRRTKSTALSASTVACTEARQDELGLTWTCRDRAEEPSCGKQQKFCLLRGAKTSKN